MNILYLIKQCPDREFLISKEIEILKKDCQINAICFSNRIYLDLDKLNEKRCVFNKIYDFTKLCSEDNRSVQEELLNYELKYNIPINEVLYADRTMINYEQEKRELIMYNLIKVALDILKECKYEVIIGELSSSSDLIFYYLSKYFNIRYLFFWHGRVSGKMEFSNILGEREGLNELYLNYKKNGITNEEKVYLDNYLDSLQKNITPDYMKFSKQTKFKNLFKKVTIEGPIKRLKKYYTSYKKDIRYSADQDPRISIKLKVKLNKILFPIKSISLKKCYDKVDLGKKFYLVPLHFQPESSTMTFATYYLNQMSFIENLSKAIPGGTYLYVKEHPAMFANRKVEFYKRLKLIPNVRLVHPEFAMDNLIKKSMGVITLTNTTGYEAIVLDRPVFVFGNVFYKEYDYSYVCRTFYEFKEYTLKAMREWESDKEQRELNRRCFILAALNSLKDANLNSHVFDKTFYDSRNINKIASNILNQINL